MAFYSLMLNCAFPKNRGILLLNETFSFVFQFCQFYPDKSIIAFSTSVQDLV